ncbi:MAG: hypothetical protein CL927_03260 [Deltaproteobacteria bacterium]|nr:hypothetical protein [Deltaproteobacteria bacterium]HCH66876.1 hypothetical protein [Deltaproteobacteria bacterium]|tara:strand:- start:146 stop:628 length:483 start_codon:yes stop_codon:yes gene_type:complete
MERRFRKPEAQEVGRMFTFLLGRPVQVTKGSRIKTGVRDLWTVGVFTTKEDAVVGVCATDLPMAVHAGAALSLFPPHKAKACIARKAIDRPIWENTLEVYNVASRFFHDMHEGMIQVGDSYQKGDDVPLEVKQFMRRSTQRVDLRVQITGYGGGSLALIG